MLVDLSHDRMRRLGVVWESEHRGCEPARQVAAAQGGDEPVLPGHLTLDALNGEDHPGAADLRVETTGIRVTGGGDDLFAVDRALVDPIYREADIGAGASITADDFLADHRAAEHRIGFTQRTIGRNAGTATRERFRRIDERGRCPAARPCRATRRSVSLLTCKSRLCRLVTQGRCFWCPVLGGLDPIEVGVRPVALHQLVAAHLGKSRAVEDDDEIGHSHGAEPVRDQDRNTADVAALRLLAARRLRIAFEELVFSLRVQRRRRSSSTIRSGVARM